MGLFDFFKKEKNVDPEEQAKNEWKNTVTYEEYLGSAESVNLFNVAKDILNIDFDFQIGKCVPILEKGWFDNNLWWKLKLPLANCLLGKAVKAQDLLVMLEARGDCATAGFMLGLFHEIGLFTCKSENETTDDPQYHYVIAESQGSRLAIVLSKLRPITNFKPSLIMDENEALVMRINPISLKMNQKELFDTLTEQDVEELRFAYTVCLGHFCQRGLPCSTMFLASAMLNWKREIVNEKAVSEIFTSNVSSSTGKTLTKNLIKSARAGNTYAIAALNNFNIDYTKDYI